MDCLPVKATSGSVSAVWFNRFSPERIAAYGDVMVAYTNRLLDRWQDGFIRDQDMMSLTSEIVSKALFDVDIE